MVDNKNFNKIVYITNFGKKYHFNVKCQYIKGKEYVGIPLYEARSKLEGACSKCANYNNYNPSINRNKNNNNNNFNFNIVQKNRNNNYFYYKKNFDNLPYSLSKNVNGMNQVINNNLHYNNNKEKEDKKNEASKNSISEINNKFSDFISSSNSLTKEINNKILLEEKSSDIDFNYFNGASDKDKNNKLHINNFIHQQKDNNNISIQSESEEKNSLSYLQNKNEIIKEEKNDENIINNINNGEVINLINKYKNQNILLNKNNITNKNNLDNIKENNFNLDNKYISEVKRKNININIPFKEQKNISNSFCIQYNSNDSSKNNNYLKNKSYFISSSSTSNIKLKNKIDINENNIIKILKETYKNSITLSNFENSYNETYNKKLIFDKGNFKFSFEIIPKPKNLVNIKIEFGFKIIYIDENNSNYNFEEESSESSNDSSGLNKTYHDYYIYKKLNVRKKMKNIIALINISKGKFFIINNQQNFDINDNKNISFLKNNISAVSDFPKIEKITEIIPIFKYNPENLNHADIIFNGQQISI